MEARIWEEKIIIPTYLLGEEDPFPPFQRGGDSAIYPYTMLDDITDERVDWEYKAVILENEFLRLIVLPELGGRLYSAYDKIGKREVFYRNNVVKPGLVALRGAWISGGIEFNFPKGHSVITVSPVDYRLIQEEGKVGVVVGSIDRTSRMRWAVRINLWEGGSLIETLIRLYNPTPFPHRFYFWANAAVPGNPSVQFIYPTEFGYYGSTIVTYPIHNGIDLSWYLNHKFAVDLFAKDCRENFFGYYDHSADGGVVHIADWREAVGKKFFTWGAEDDGLIWAEILSDEDGPYCEIQSGRFQDQSTYEFLEPHQVESWREIWLPIRGMKGFVWANEDCVVNLKREEGRIAIGANVPLPIPSAKVLLKSGQESLYEEEVDLLPQQPYLRYLPSAPSDAPLSLKILSPRGEVISYEEKVQRKEKIDLSSGKKEEKDSCEALCLKGLEKERFRLEKEAMVLYRRALDEEEGFSPAHISLGRLLLKRGKWEESEWHLRKALERNPHSEEALYYLGLLLKMRERFEEAGECLWRIRCRAFASPAHYLLGTMAVGQGAYRDGEKFFRKMVEENPRDVKARDALSIALRKQGKQEEAKEVLRGILALDPLDHLAYYELHLLGEGEGKFKRMLKKEGGLPIKTTWGEIRHCNDGYLFEVDLYLELACDYISFRLWEDAISLLEGFLRESKPFPLLHYYLAYLYDKVGEEAQSRKYLEAGSEGSPDFLFPHRLEELEILEWVVERNPSDAVALYALGNLLYSLGREEEGIGMWERALERKPFPSLLRNLAFGYKEVRGDKERAEEYYKRAISLQPNWRLYLELDKLYSELGEQRKRVELLVGAPLEVTKHSQIAGRLAEALVELGAYQTAIGILSNYTFKPWEGEVRMRQIYYRAHLEQGKRLFEEGEYEKALHHFEMALQYPRNIGVGRPYNAKDEEAKEWKEKVLKILNRK